MSALQRLHRVAAFLLLAPAVVHCQTAVSTPPAPTAKKTSNTQQKKDTAKKPPEAPNSGAPAANGRGTQAPSPAAAKDVPVVRLENARVDAIVSDDANLSLTDCVQGPPDPQKVVCNGKAFHLKVNDLALRAKVKPFHPGDHVRVDIKDGSELQDIQGAWSYPPEGVSAYRRLLVLGACALVLFGIAAAVTRGSPLKFIVGLDIRYSTSKFQVCVWFWILTSTYIATVAFRLFYAGWEFFGGVSIPQNLLVLSGLSAITFGGAKAITTAKADAAAHPVTPPGGVAKAPNPDPKNANDPGEERFFRDLFQDDFGHFDFGDFQMLMVTLIAVVMYLTLVFRSLGSVEFLKTVSLPDVDTTILAGFGLGHGAYLAKKAGGDPGTS